MKILSLGREIIIAITIINSFVRDIEIFRDKRAAVNFTAIFLLGYKMCRSFLRQNILFL